MADLVGMSKHQTYSLLQAYTKKQQHTQHVCSQRGLCVYSCVDQRCWQRQEGQPWLPLLWQAPCMKGGGLVQTTCTSGCSLRCAAGSAASAASIDRGRSY